MNRWYGVLTSTVVLVLACSSGADTSPPDSTVRADAPADVLPPPDSAPRNDLDTELPEPIEDSCVAEIPESPVDAVPELPDATSPEDLAADTPGGELVDGGLDLLPDDLATTDLSGDVMEPPIDLVQAWPLGEVEKTCGKGLLAVLDSPSGPIRIMLLRGSHYEMGHQAGCLVGADIGQFFNTLIAYFAAEIEDAAADLGFPPDETMDLLLSMLNNIWLHMEPFVPAAFTDEFAGFEDAVLADEALAAHWADTKPEWALKALILLSNISDLNWDGGMEEVLEKLSVGASPEVLAHYSQDEIALLLRLMTRQPACRPTPLPLRTTCSFFAAWGPRTVQGHLLASRNLDWSTDTGIATLKGITIFAPDDGHAHASIGYLGFFGALAGMSERGLVLSEVGSESTMERLWGQPWTLKFREIMEQADDLDGAVAMAAGITEDGTLRPPTIGYNWLVAYGDPQNEGAAAAAVAVESNGIVASLQRGTSDCGAKAQVVEYAQDGSIVAILDNETHPAVANLEANAVEIDHDGQPRLFVVDDEGTFALNGNGCPQLSPDGTGQPWTVGRALPCGLVRSSEALTHANRRYQLASNGPGHGGNKLMCDSGGYRSRYLLMHDMLAAYEQGTGYEYNGTTYIEPAGQPVPVGLPEAEHIARAAAMGSNVMGIAYDATALALRVSYETGSAENWEGAHKHDWVGLELAPVFALLDQVQQQAEE